MKETWMCVICLLGFSAGLTLAADLSARYTDPHPYPAPSVIGFSRQELNHGSPFDSEIQRRTFWAVAQAMFIRQVDPAIPMPKVVVNTSISLAELPDYLGFELDTNKLNYYSYRKNAILLSENAKIHNLAHEMTHYFQFHYRLKGNVRNMCTDPEPEAVRIQHDFRPEAKKPPVEGLASRSYLDLSTSRIK